MLRASWKSLMGHKVRMLMSAFAIVLGVAFVSGSLLFTEMMSSSINGLLKGTTSDVSVVNKGAYDEDATTAQAMGFHVTPQLVNKVGKVDGVSAAVGTNVATTYFPLSKEGKVFGSTQAPTVLTNYIDAPAAGGQTGVSILSGHAPAHGEVLIDPTALESSGYSVGDRLPVLSVETGQTFTLKIVGTATWGSGSTLGATYLFVSDQQAKDLVTHGKDVYQAVWVATEQGADVATVTKDINKILPSDLEAMSADEVTAQTQESIDQGLAFINTFLLVFAAIALVVATFLIVNTFSIIVAQRGRELALLRAMGASRGQVRLSVLIEATIVALFGATVGVGVGWLLAMGINVLMASSGFDLGGTLPAISPVVLIVSYSVAVFVTLIAAYVPAARASRVPPVAAMTGDYQTGKSGLGKRAILATVLVCVGAVLMAGGLGGWLPEPLAMVGVGALLLLLGVASASPLLGRPVTWVLGWLYRALFGSVGRLAELNATRNPRRTAATASALMIGLALVVTMSILGQSAKTSTEDLMSSTFRGDLLVTSRVGQIAPSVGDNIEDVDGVDEVYRTRLTDATVGSKAWYVEAMAPGTVGKTQDLTMVKGQLNRDPNTVVVLEDEAKKNGYDIGSTITVTLGEKPVNLVVSGWFTAPEETFPAELIINFATWNRADLPDVDYTYTIYTDPGVSVDAVMNRVDKATADQPLVNVEDLAAVQERMTSRVDQLLSIIYALLALAVVIAVLGIVNTLALSVIERTREIGLLRAIGLTRGQLRRMVTLEAVVVALLGAFLGVGLGLVFGVALQRLLVDQGLEQLAIPWSLLGSFLAVSVVVGILAAVWPARRASKLDVLQAIATE